MRLRRWDPAGPAILRRRRGRGFGYVDVGGEPLCDDEALARITGLVIPPAWKDVRICPWPHGHLQAVGTDDAGRRQYLYHEAWRVQRDREKFARVREFGRTLPKARVRIAEDLATRGLNRRRVLATAARLLDIGFFRIGSEAYAQENGSHGLATVLRSHVSVARGGASSSRTDVRPRGRRPTLVFEYPAKSGQERVQAVADEDVVAVVRALMRRREPHQTLLAYFEGRAWHEVRSADINDYLHEICGDDNSAKDFRTWHGTVLAAVALATALDDPAALSRTARRRAEARAIKEVAEYLGNTPAVCRSAYVDPAVIQAFQQGVTVRRTLERLGTDDVLVGEEDRERVERAVLDLLDEVG
ncbi:DNA topoisomerase IB [Jiangella aurantiaca]|uniref:DNA topoisomerase IB n=1 Tax=Jiangella aurantiaca TaxID=2530373 RepID=A0A4R5AH86_9ACTN|nr:DNA topoisomerase IB [Jiangella aurantiaca]TDD71045.1 DNA topoisomerase IB [Jiangella aurantiaca]